MFRKHQKLSFLFVVISVGLLLLFRESYAVPTVKLMVNPSVLDIAVGSESIALTARASGSNLQFEWKLLGPGEFEGSTTESAVFYKPPDTIEGKSAKAIITIKVTDDKGEDATESVIFNIKQKGDDTPTPIPTPQTYKNDWTHKHEADYSGKVWIKIVPKPENQHIEHKYEINWGPWEYKNQIIFGDRSSVSLWHRKGIDDHPIPLFFHISPECDVTFGTGEPPDEFAIDINEGWKEKK